jgi:SAM-dependent methyltransferase
MVSVTGATGRCPACGSTATQHAFVGRDRSLHAVEGTFSYARCTRCRSVFADPQPDDTTLAAAYAASYGNYQSQPTLLERVGAPIARHEARRLVRHAGSGGRLLDLGCGTGRFLERLGDCAWPGERRGVEFDAEVARRTAARLNLDVRAGTVEDTHVEPGSLKAIVLRHVIEHVRDPVGQLTRLRDALEPGGLMYIGTPDARALAARIFGEHWWGYEIPRHLCVFSANALEHALRRCGYTVVDRWSGWSPQMWSASLGLRLDAAGRGDRASSRLLTHPASPIGLPLFGAASAAEVALGRSTMLSVVARRAD